MPKTIAKDTTQPNQTTTQKKSKIKPLVLALVFALVAFIVPISALFSPSSVPPSSTAGIAFVFVVPGAFILAVIAAAIGLFLGRISLVAKPVVFFPLILLVIILGSLLIYMRLTTPLFNTYEVTNKIGVKTDVGMIKKVPLTNGLLNNDIFLDCSSFYMDVPADSEIRTNHFKRAFPWLEDEITFSTDGFSFYRLQNSNTGSVIEKSIKDYSLYINSVSVAPYTKEQDSYLFVLLNLRATSNRSLLTVYKYPDEVVFEELLERSTQLHPYLVLGMGKLADQDIVTVSAWGGQYPNEFPDEYGYCYPENEVKEEDFRIHNYGYQINP
jgi:hypothetical protein